MALAFLKKANEITPIERDKITSIIREREYSQRDVFHFPGYSVIFFTGEDAPISREGLVRLRKNLSEEKIDVISFGDGFLTGIPKLIFMDMDSTVIQEEVIDELAREHGVFDEVQAVTKTAMEGGMDFDSSLRLRVNKLKGLPVSSIEKVYRRLTLSLGMNKVLEIVPKFGTELIILSGGFLPVLQLFAKDHKISDFRANQLEEKDGIFTGEITGPILNAEAKEKALVEIVNQKKCDRDLVVAIGDGANDALMLRAAGLGIGFHAKQGLKDRIDQWVDYSDLDALLLLFRDQLINV